jgi:4-hydroxythreonine-4-phosphate dehydrogenase
MGDPAGIGPEIIASAWPRLAASGARQRVRYMVVGDPRYLERAGGFTGRTVRAERITSLDRLDAIADTTIPCWPAGDVEAPLVKPGSVDPVAGRAAFEYLEEAIRLTLAGQTSAIVTAPIHKLAIHQAGFCFPGHTEILAARCGVADYAMMLYIPPGQDVGAEIGLGVVHTTLHQSLRSAIDDLTTPLILEKVRLAREFGTRLLSARQLVRQPRIAVAALNPHAGEAGLFGDEELRLIAPAVNEARGSGIACDGPLPCDTLMARAARGEFDLVVAMYHDQGHIALKLLGMHKAVNVTLGLPIVRTSVAHGTAFDIAGTGKADGESLVRAAETAAQLSAGLA